MERTFKGMLFATAAGAVMLAAASAEAAFCVANGVAYDLGGGSVTSSDATCAQNSLIPDPEEVNATASGASYVSLTGFSGIEMLGLVAKGTTDSGNNDVSGLFEGSLLNTAQPDNEDINDLKIAVGEASDASLIKDLGKLPEEGPLTGVATLDTGEIDNSANDSGTITIDANFDLLNIILKDGQPAGPAIVFALAGVTKDTVLEYRFHEGELSNVQLSSVVPLPAAAWMFIGGLGIIGGAVARNRRKAQADA